MSGALRTRMLALFGGVLLTVGSTANAVPVSQVPLFLSASVAPNVMLMIDNSGSMKNIIWASGYSTATKYTDWSRVNNGNSAWAFDDGNISGSNLVSNGWRTSGSGTDCAAGWSRGRKSDGTIKCLKLPDPVGGGNTWWTGNYLNYLFQTYATNTDLGTGTIPNAYRYSVAKNVATNIVTANAGLRFGLSSFNNAVSGDSPGGKIDAVCGTSTATLVSTIAALPLALYTPLAETYYEVTRYFRGISSRYNSGVTYTSPIQYRCQKNFVIMITDGYPTTDTDIPTDDPADIATLPTAFPRLGWSESGYPGFPIPELSPVLGWFQAVRKQG